MCAGKVTENLSTLARFSPLKTRKISGQTLSSDEAGSWAGAPP